MALLERVSTLVRANLNDLIDKAEHPEKMLKQVIVDMQNQLLQVKTQVALALADQHLLEKRQKEHEANAGDWMRRAELAIDKGQEDLGRAAIERSMGYSEMGERFAEQAVDQKLQAENLKTALRKLEHKMAEAQAKCELLLAQHRRSRALGKASDAHAAAIDGSKAAAFDRMQHKVAHLEAVSTAKAELAAGDEMEARLEALEKQEKIERVLVEIKARKSLPS
jgi:phage shock protein A